jgi:NAD(P)-dependent dehydrogenase (short-subunit alcohol dehydrogenase family)
VLITGATGGIGKATAVGLAAMGAHLAVTGRDTQRTQAASDEIRNAGGGAQVDVFVAEPVRPGVRHLNTSTASECHYRKPGSQEPDVTESRRPKVHLHMGQAARGSSGHTRR